MKLHRLDRSISKNQSFNVRRNKYPNFLKIWHYHKELELVYVIKSKGTRFVGDSIELFEEKDVVLVGENVPHMWLNNEVYFMEDKDLIAESITIHFEEDFLGKKFINLPENKPIKKILKDSQLGIRFIDLDDKTLKKLEKLPSLKGFKKLNTFLEIIYLLSDHKNTEHLSNKSFVEAFQNDERKEITDTYEFIYKNFRDPITLNDVADVAKMNPSAFSRLFKKMNRKSFTQFLNEIRIRYACQLLLEQKDRIADICYDSGYNNLSNFNRQFKKITDLSPSAYIKKFKN